jgi:hypothetical protein
MLSEIPLIVINLSYEISAGENGFGTRMMAAMEKMAMKQQL